MTNKTLKNIKNKALSLTISGALLCFGVTNANAGNLYDYKEKGLIGETTTGLVASTSKNTSAEVQALIQKINNQRIEKYKSIAAQQNISLSVVQKLAAKNIYSQLPSGQYFQGPENNWLKKD